MTMAKGAAALNANINEFYDASMFSPQLVSYYGGSDYTNFGYRTEASQDARTACDALMARLLSFKIGRAHVWTPVTNAPLVCRLLLEKKKKQTQNTYNAYRSSRL